MFHSLVPYREPDTPTGPGDRRSGGARDAARAGAQGAKRRRERRSEPDAQRSGAASKPTSASRGEKPPVRLCKPRGSGLLAPAGEGGRRPPEARSEAENKNPLRARWARSGGATPTRARRQTWHEGGGPRKRERTTTPTRREEASAKRPIGAAAKPGRRSQGRAPAGSDDRRYDQQRAGERAERPKATPPPSVGDEPRSRPPRGLSSALFADANESDGGPRSRRGDGGRQQAGAARREAQAKAGVGCVRSPLLTASQSDFHGVGRVIPLPTPSETLSDGKFRAILQIGSCASSCSVI